LAFQRAECGAVYGVAITRLAARADYDAICNVCQKVMNEWHGTVGHAYTLKSQFANAVATVEPHQFIHPNRPLLYFWSSAKLTG
jgi:predicted kinase